MSSLEQAKESVALINNWNLSPKVVKTEGAGKAYQAVAQSMSLAIQDATEHLRNVSAVAQAAIAVSTELMIANKQVYPYSQFIDEAQQTVDKAEQTFKRVGMDAGDILNNFPSGE
ncbi:MAG: hypothetical protein F6J93_08585 [Oscillatoria sp. SIO1A7]|nr:hypothetical protein [Oscillatoria sp. SIO1A7]